MRKNRKVWQSVVGSFLLLAMPVSWVITAPAMAASEKSPILIGIAHDLSGYNSEHGRAERDGAILAIEEWNAKGGVNGGRKIEYIIRDDSGDAGKSTTIAKEFVSKKVTAVVGGTSSGAAIPASKILTEERIVYLATAASRSIYEPGRDGKVWAFCQTATTPVMAAALVPKVLRKGYKRIAFFYNNAAFAKDLVEMQKKIVAEQQGVQIVGDIVVDLKAKDLTPDVMRLREMKPDAVIAILYPDSSKAYFVAASNIGWRPIVPSYNMWSLFESAYKASEKTLFWGAAGIEAYKGVKPAFVKKQKQFVARFGYEAVGTFAPAYDSMNLLLEAIDAVGPNGSAVRDYLETKAAGRPIVAGDENAKADFTLTHLHSLIRAEDYAAVSVNEKGEMVWEQ